MYNIALYELPVEDALSRENINELLDLMDTSGGVIPITIEGDFSIAMGFVEEAASYLYERDHYHTAKEIRKILYDMNLESPDGTYSIDGLNIIILR